MNTFSYLISGISYLSKAVIISTGIYLFFTIALLLKWRKDFFTKSVKRLFYIKEYIFCTYIITLGMITGILGDDFYLGLHELSFNIIPFRNVDVVQMLLNILLFIPMGAFIPILNRKMNSCIWIIGISGISSVSIELIQMIFRGRLADINDIIANSLGALVGFILYRFFSSYLSKYTNNEYGTGTLSIFWGGIACFLNIRYGGICIGTVFLYNLGLKTMNLSILNLYSELIIIGISIIGYYAGKRHPEDFLAKSGRCLAIISMIISLIFILFTPKNLILR